MSPKKETNDPKGKRKNLLTLVPLSPTLIVNQKHQGSEMGCYSTHRPRAQPPVLRRAVPHRALASPARDAVSAAPHYAVLSLRRCSGLECGRLPPQSHALLSASQARYSNVILIF